MMRARVVALAAVSVVAASVILISSGAAPRSAAVARPVVSSTWNPRAAASYLDQRQSWWEYWPKAARDHGTVCVSCHTALPYALARPALGATLHEADSPAAERKLLADVATRVLAWNAVKPFYGDTSASGRTKAIQSRGTESVLNALILASRDHRTGVMSAEGRQAFDNMIGQQQTSGDDSGAWPWLDFGLQPWESRTAGYFGAALGAIAIGTAPQNYAATRDLQPTLMRLRTYLREHIDQPLWRRVLRGDDPRLFNRAMLLWASARLPGLISRDEQREIVGTLEQSQEPDGAWRLTSLGRWRHADVAVDSAGDGFATGLVAYALEQSGTQPNEPHLARALAWLAGHQDPATGSWPAWSLNKRRDVATNVGKFMSDAATAYAALALAAASR